MGLLQPHGGYRRGYGQAVIGPVVIHGLEDALAAAVAARSLGLSIDLITQPGASAYIGAVFFAAIVREARAQAPEVGAILYDCGMRRGDVLAGLRAGLREFCLDAEAMAPALSSLAETQGARIVQRPGPCFTTIQDWVRACSGP